MRRARFAHHRVESVAHARIGKAHQARHLAQHAAQRARHHEVVDGARLHRAAPEQRTQCAGHDVEIARIAHPALLPPVVEGLALAAEVVDEIHCALFAADELRRSRTFSHQQRDGTRAVAKLRRSARTGEPVFRGHEQNGASVGSRRGEGVDETRGAGALGGADVHGADALVEAERVGEQGRVLPIREGRARGGEVYRGNVLALGPQAVPARLYRQGQGVLVPVAHRALSLAERAQGG